jgi:hypothetical protein
LKRSFNDSDPLKLATQSSGAVTVRGCCRGLVSRALGSLSLQIRVRGTSTCVLQCAVSESVYFADAGICASSGAVHGVLRAALDARIDATLAAVTGAA